MAYKTAGEKELKTKYPVEKGLTAETNTQTDRVMTLVAERGSLVRRNNKIGITD